MTGSIGGLDRRAGNGDFSPTASVFNGSSAPENIAFWRLMRAARADAGNLDGLYAVPEIKGAGARFAKASGEKCARCWRVLEEVDAHTHLCNRCTGAVKGSAAEEKIDSGEGHGDHVSGKKDGEGEDA